MKAFAFALISALAVADHEFGDGYSYFSVGDYWNMEMPTSSTNSSYSYVDFSYWKSLDGTHDDHVIYTDSYSYAWFELDEPLGEGDTLEAWACIGEDGCRFFSWSTDTAFIDGGEVKPATGTAESTLDYLKNAACSQPSAMRDTELGVYQRSDPEQWEAWWGDEGKTFSLSYSEYQVEHFLRGESQGVTDWEEWAEQQDWETTDGTTPVDPIDDTWTDEAIAEWEDAVATTFDFEPDDSAGLLSYDEWRAQYDDWVARTLEELSDAERAAFQQVIDLMGQEEFDRQNDFQASILYEEYIASRSLRLRKQSRPFRKQTKKLQQAVALSYDEFVAQQEALASQLLEEMTEEARAQQEAITQAMKDQMGDDYETFIDQIYRQQYEEYVAGFSSSTSSGSTTGGSTSGSSTSSSSTSTGSTTDHDHTEDHTPAGEGDGTVEVVSGYWIQRARQPAVCAWSSYRQGNVAQVEERFAKALRIWKATEDASAREIAEACDDYWEVCEEVLYLDRNDITERAEEEEDDGGNGGNGGSPIEEYTEYDPATVNAYRVLYWTQVLIAAQPAILYVSYGTEWDAMAMATSLVALGLTTVGAMAVYTLLGRMLSISEGNVQLAILRWWVPFTSWVINLGQVGLAYLIVEEGNLSAADEEAVYAAAAAGAALLQLVTFAFRAEASDEIRMDHPPIVRDREEEPAPVEEVEEFDDPLVDF